MDLRRPSSVVDGFCRGGFIGTFISSGFLRSSTLNLIVGWGICFLF